MINIPNIKRKPARPAYRKPESIKILERMDFDFRYRDSIIPENVRTFNKFRDDTSNGLTKSILCYLKINNVFCTRLNSTGIYRADLGKYVPNTQRKGLADIIAIYNGVSLNIEVKIGKDRMSEHQIKIKNEVEQSGGIYFLARSFTEFKIWFDELKGDQKTNKGPRMPAGQQVNHPSGGSFLKGDDNERKVFEFSAVPDEDGK